MAAGLGFKTFTTGEVLTAADTNGYLMQGILVFASEAARNSAITSPQEGQFAFTKDTNSTWYYDGAAWVASGASGDVTGVTAGTGITVTNPTGPVPTVTNDMATTITASGDIVVGTGSGTYDNLPIGTTGQILTADTTVSPYKVKWASASAAGKSYSLINTGGTALTGAATITVSSISGMDNLMVMVMGASSTTAGSDIFMRINSDTGNNYRWGGPMIIGGAGYDSNSFTTSIGNPTSLMRMFVLNAGTATGTGSGTASILGCNTTGIKAFTVMGAGANDSGNSQRSYWYNGVYLGTSTISSIDIVSNSGNFDAGTVYVYGAA